LSGGVRCVVPMRLNSSAQDVERFHSLRILETLESKLKEVGRGPDGTAASYVTIAHRTAPDISFWIVGILPRGAADSTEKSIIKFVTEIGEEAESLMRPEPQATAMD
jgi:hypothetical protein